MLKNLKHSILFILIVIILLSVVFISLAASKPVSQNKVKGISIPVDPIINGKWSGLQMCLYPWWDTDICDAQVDTLLANGFTELRFNAMSWLWPEYDKMAKAAAIRAIAKGAKVIWGNGPNSQIITASNWASYRTTTLDLAQWAQDNGIFEFQLGNELEYSVDNTTMTWNQLVANIKVLATDVQAIFTRGNVSYTCGQLHISRWVSAGKGDLDILASNIYRKTGSGDKPWMNYIDSLVSTFGPTGTAITEFGPHGDSLDAWSTDETVQSVATNEMLDYIKASGITRAFYFTYGYRYEFGCLKSENGPYRLLWNTLTSGTSTSAPNITLLPLSKDFGSVDISSAANPGQTFTIQNTGSANLTVGTVTITGTDASQFAKSGDSVSGQTIAAGASKTLTVTFDPSAVGAKTASMSIPSNDPDSPALNVNLTGTGTTASAPNITITPTSKDFGSVDIGSAANPGQVFTIQNTGSANLTVGTVTITGTDAGQFAKSGDSVSGQTIAAGASKTLTVTFDPSAVGAKTASMSIPSNDPDSPALNVNLTGTGTTASAPNITITPTSKDFGSVDISSLANPGQTFTIQNTGSANLTVGTVTITGTDASQFVKSGDTASGQTIAAGASKTITVTFDPSAVGAKTASMSIPSNDPDMPTLTVSLTGSGTTASAPDITVSPASKDSSSVDTSSVANPGDLEVPSDTAFVTRFYQECLSRDPDSAGLNGWVNWLESGAKTGADVAYGFVFSDEFILRNVSNSEYLTILYRAFFNREPDSGGYSGWLGYLNTGKSRQWVLAGFINSDEFKNLCAAYGINSGSN
jgi:hypothetical protein